MQLPDYTTFYFCSVLALALPSGAVTGGSDVAPYPTRKDAIPEGCNSMFCITEEKSSKYLHYSIGESESIWLLWRMYWNGARIWAVLGRHFQMAAAVKAPKLGHAAVTGQAHLWLTTGAGQLRATHKYGNC